MKPPRIPIAKLGLLAVPVTIDCALLRGESYAYCWHDVQKRDNASESTPLSLPGASEMMPRYWTLFLFLFCLGCSRNDYGDSVSGAVQKVSVAGDNHDFGASSAPAAPVPRDDQVEAAKKDERVKRVDSKEQASPLAAFADSQT